jgi:hypothetical protein
MPSRMSQRLAYLRDRNGADSCFAMRERRDEPDQLRILETPQEMSAVEELQRHVWPGDETDVVPAHMPLAAAHNGGLVIGAFSAGEPGGEDEHAELEWGEIQRRRPGRFVFGFRAVLHRTARAQNTIRICSASTPINATRAPVSV